MDPRSPSTPSSAPAVTELVTHYRAEARAGGPPRATPGNALTEAERAEVLAVLTSPRFTDKSEAARVRQEMLATGPQQAWSWDINKLGGPDGGSHYDLCVIHDTYCR